MQASDKQDLARRLCADTLLGEAAERCIERADERSESPIETLFVAAFMLVMQLESAGRDWDGATVFSFGVAPSGKYFSGVQQYCWQNYRVDFALFASCNPAVFVECDGFEFHERTADQAERDRARDRAVQTAGIVALRFTGREIWRDPVACATAAWEALWAEVRRWGT
jgi:very-short-patch-repair endonuclease